MAQSGDCLSRGFLPLTALHDRGPTTVGLVELGEKTQVVSPEGRTYSSAHPDCLLLISLHHEPLAVIHLEGHPTSLTEEELAATIWPLVGDKIRKHAHANGCITPPSDHQALAGGLQADRCQSAAPPETADSAAVILSTIGQEPAQLERCLDSLLEQKRARPEILVVDNRPGEGATREIVSRFSTGEQRVRYVPEPRPGLSRARNRGLAETEATYVAFTDDDVVVDRLWLAWLLAPFVDADVAVACGMVLPYKLETEAQKGFERYLGFSRGVDRHTYDRSSGAAASPFYPFLADVFGSGNSMAFRRRELLEIGGFDPALGAGSPAKAGEETDVFSKAILRGRKIVYEPRALSWHEHRRDLEALKAQIFGYGVGVGALLTKALLSDPRFYRAAATGLFRRGRWGARVDRTANRSKQLLRARRFGILQGPWRYAQGKELIRKLDPPARRSGRTTAI